MTAVTGFTLGDEGATTPVKSTLGIADHDALRAVPDFPAAAGPPPVVTASSAGQGALNLLPDADGKIRRMPLVFRLAGKPVPSVDADAIRLAAGTDISRTSAVDVSIHDMSPVWE